MVLSYALPVLLLFAPCALAAPGGDVVNERPPVRRAELEAHWQVDCSASWLELVSYANAYVPKDRCQLSPALRRQLQLCVFIYQPPGELAYADCPDYQGALERSHSIASCGELAAWLTAQGDCPAAGRAD